MNIIQKLGKTLGNTFYCFPSLVPTFRQIIKFQIRKFHLLYDKLSIYSKSSISLSSASSATCRTTDGDSCYFPFTYRSEVFHSCTDARYHTFWCSTVPDYDGNLWGTCVVDDCLHGEYTTFKNFSHVVTMHRRAY